MYIYIIISIIALLVIPIISTQIIKNAKLKKHTDKPLIMAASKFFSYTLLFIYLFFCFWTFLISIYDDFGLGFEIVMIVFICILSYFCIQSFREKIVIYTDFLCYSPTLGKTRKIYFKDVIDVKIKKYNNGMISIMYIQQMANFFSNYAKGYNILQNKLKKHINYNI